MARKPKRMPTFFKVLLGDFTEKLRIPPSFVKKFEKIMPKAPTLKSKEGKSFVVSVISNEDGCFFKRGWNKFVKNYDLEMGDFLVFNMVNERTFQVVIYGKTGCEKESKVVSDLEKSSNSSRSSVSSEIKEIKNKKQNCVKEEIKIKKRGPGRPKKRDSPKLSSQLKKPQVSATKAGGSNKQGSKNVQRNTEMKEKERVETNNPYFIKILKTYQKYNLAMPKSFAIKTGLISKKNTKIKDPEGRKWLVEIKVVKFASVCQVHFNSGWVRFHEANGLAAGDICVFHFITKKNNLIEVEIHKNGTRETKSEPAKLSKSVQSEPIEIY